MKQSTDQQDNNKTLHHSADDVAIEDISDIDLSDKEMDSTDNSKVEEIKENTEKENDESKEKEMKEESPAIEPENPEQEKDVEENKETKETNEKEADNKKEETPEATNEAVEQEKEKEPSSDETSVDQERDKPINEPSTPTAPPPADAALYPILPKQEKSVKEVEIKEENTKVQPVEENFWIENNYRKVVRRIEDGSKTLDDLSKMIHERAEIENLYATKLKAWQNKWFEASNKSFEYGTSFSAVIGGLKEGVSLADLHSSVYTRLEGLSKSIQEWRNEVYPKTLTKIKEAKRSEEVFAKAQKPWVIKYNEVKKCMKAYHSANHLWGLAKTEEKSSTELTAEQKTKLQTKVKKLEQEIDVNKEKYKEALRDISNYNPKYMDDMQYEFGKCQKFEEARRTFIKEKLIALHACLDRTIFIENYKDIYAELSVVYQNIHIQNDLNWYQQSYGIDHPFVTLSYVEYDPALHNPHETPANGQTNQRATLSPSSKQKKSGVCTTL